MDKRENTLFCNYKPREKIPDWGQLPEWTIRICNYYTGGGFRNGTGFARCGYPMGVYEIPGAGTKFDSEGIAQNRQRFL